MLIQEPQEHGFKSYYKKKILELCNFALREKRDWKIKK